ncbi:MAG: hypothetical protein OQJ97_08365 [Rhodospirillales bacterium]|nr:hypothetical protein [Rhodospirillales bacterium]
MTVHLLNVKFCAVQTAQIKGFAQIIHTSYRRDPGDHALNVEFSAECKGVEPIAAKYYARAASLKEHD